MAECAQYQQRVLGVNYPYIASSSIVLAEWTAEQSGACKAV